MTKAQRRLGKGYLGEDPWPFVAGSQAACGVGAYVGIKLERMEMLVGTRL